MNATWRLLTSLFFVHFAHSITCQCQNDPSECSTGASSCSGKYCFAVRHTNLTTNRVIAFQSCTNESVIISNTAANKAECYKYPSQNAEQVICYCATDKCNDQTLIDEFKKKASCRAEVSLVLKLMLVLIAYLCIGGNVL
ncbi:hypothetical protein QR680_006521 [Steinernema hermaphroditum]|uniref:Activin types I and II receptor domain-containing protein n=1 Tax=Steinernema hermaphroditum TaxID=289476 RepID=A0AA39LX98_9BILA|nr:hypothetical protein QR680_006521 [Steinernema hermaphroditum]